jgi:uncharacterized protein
MRNIFHRIRCAHPWRLLAVLGGGLFFFMWWNDELLVPALLEPMVRVAYRIPFLAALPARIPFLILLPREDYHYSVLHKILTYGATPIFWYGVYRLLRWGYRKLCPVHADVATPSKHTAIGRRAFLAKAVSAPVALGMGGAWGYGACYEPGHIRFPRYDLAITGLPKALEGFRLAHVSDTHYGPFMSKAFLEDMVTSVNGLDVDMVALTGDYVHKTPRAIGPGIAVLGGFEARLGAMAVLGNHEHWEGADRCREVFASVKVPVLDNAACFLTDKGIESHWSGEDAVCLAGIGDLWAGNAFPAKALDGLHKELPRLLLSHNPDVAELLPRHLRVDAMLSGHTHGGQVWLPVKNHPYLPSHFGGKYAGGLCQGPQCPVLVSRGVGLAGIPMRMGVPPEVGIVTLRRAWK